MGFKSFKEQIKNRIEESRQRGVRQRVADKKLREKVFQERIKSQEVEALTFEKERGRIRTQMKLSRLRASIPSQAVSKAGSRNARASKQFRKSVNQPISKKEAQSDLDFLMSM